MMIMAKKCKKQRGVAVWSGSVQCGRVDGLRECVLLCLFVNKVEEEGLVYFVCLPEKRS